MTPEQFIQYLKDRVVNENLELYKDIFISTKLDSIKDPYFKRASIYFSSLDNSQKEAFFEVIKQVIIDTTSTILGVIDGTTTLSEGIVPNLHLLCNNSLISGYMQDIFLSLIEENGS